MNIIFICFVSVMNFVAVRAVGDSKRIMMRPYLLLLKNLLGVHRQTISLWESFF